MDEIEIFRKGFRKKSQGFWKWADFKEKKCWHLGKLPRSIHGKLPIERHFPWHAIAQTYILRKILNNMHSWSYRCLVGLWFRVDRSHASFKIPPLVD